MSPHGVDRVKSCPRLNYQHIMGVSFLSVPCVQGGGGAFSSWVKHPGSHRVRKRWGLESLSLSVVLAYVPPPLSPRLSGLRLSILKPFSAR